MWGGHVFSIYKVAAELSNMHTESMTRLYKQQESQMIEKASGLPGM